MISADIILSEHLLAKILGALHASDLEKWKLEIVVQIPGSDFLPTDDQMYSLTISFASINIL